jgi:hypothetical protein
MATSVFSPRTGAVVKVKPDASTTGVFTITVNGAPLTLPVTGFALDMNTNHQFLHTLNDFIYVHVFGERIGELTVSGMCFMGDTCNNPELSVKSALTQYNQYRLSKTKRGYPIALSDAGTFWGFLTGMRIDSARPDLMMAQWSMRFHVIQNNSGPISSLNMWRPPSSNYMNTFPGGFLDGPVLT